MHCSLVDFQMSVPEYGIVVLSYLIHIRPFNGKALTQILSVFFLQPKLIAVSTAIAFANPKAPVYPRLAQGKSWNEVHCYLLYGLQP